MHMCMHMYIASVFVKLEALSREVITKKCIQKQKH